MIELREGKAYKSYTTRLQTGCGSLFCTIVFDKEVPVKAFLALGKAGGCVKAHLSNLSELVNIAIGHGIDEAILDLSAVTGITCSESNISAGVFNCTDAVVRHMLKLLLNIRDEGEIDDE